MVNDLDEMNAQGLYTKVINWIRVFFADKPRDVKAIIGISGGKDSSICAALLTSALGTDRVLGVLIPNGEQSDIADSEEICKHLHIKYVKVNIGKVYNELTKEILSNSICNAYKGIAVDGPKSAYKTNTPARLRMVTLYGIAHQCNGFVVNTCNLSESIVGWETYGGDGFGDFSPLGKLTVKEVIALGDYMNLPKHLVHKTPSDGMCGSSDEDKLGFTYAELDESIRNSVVGPNFEKILEMNRKSHFKHDNIHIPTFDPHFTICEAFNW